MIGKKKVQKTISPIDGSVLVERPYADEEETQHKLGAARRAQRIWRRVPVAERAAICTRFVEAFEQNRDAIAEELTRQMGRPIAHSPGEVRGLAERSRYMISIAEESLRDIDPGEKPGFERFIRREPVGVVLVLAPWNYPYLTAVNSIVPAILAGNAVVLKHSSQTPLCAERFLEAFRAAGLPEGVFDVLVLTHDDTARVIDSPEVDFVAFTGSVDGGHAVVEAARKRFIGLGLELGGKDPAYVRPDAPFNETVENLVDGAFFNAGQSCCAIERIYVHNSIYDAFVQAFVAKTREYVLGSPLEPTTTLGPMVRTNAAEFVRRQIVEAVSQGARPLIDPADFPLSKPGSPYLAPQVLVDVTHEMDIMTEETFGPAIGIMSVASDEEAIRLMNDSRFGLTASIWTSDLEAAIRLGERVETGTLFMNRCDYLDPALAWVGIKDSGRGCTLSSVGFEQVTRPKSFHLRPSF